MQHCWSPYVSVTKWLLVDLIPRAIWPSRKGFVRRGRSGQNYHMVLCIKRLNRNTDHTTDQLKAMINAYEWQMRITPNGTMQPLCMQPRHGFVVLRLLSFLQLLLTVPDWRSNEFRRIGALLVKLERVVLHVLSCDQLQAGMIPYSFPSPTETIYTSIPPLGIAFSERYLRFSFISCIHLSTQVDICINPASSQCPPQQNTPTALATTPSSPHPASPLSTPGPATPASQTPDSQTVPQQSSSKKSSTSSTKAQATTETSTTTPSTTTSGRPPTSKCPSAACPPRPRSPSGTTSSTFSTREREIVGICTTMLLMAILGMERRWLRAAG